MRPRTLCPLPSVMTIIRVIIQSSSELLVVKGNAPMSQAGEAGQQQRALRCLNRKWMLMVFPGQQVTLETPKLTRTEQGSQGQVFTSLTNTKGHLVVL